MLGMLMVSTSIFHCTGIPAIPPPIAERVTRRRYAYTDTFLLGIRLSCDPGHTTTPKHAVFWEWKNRSCGA
jgi:hypothetical protein